MTKPKLTIVIPNYNEKENIQAGVLEEVKKYLRKADFTWEVLISDDGSTDGSLDLVEKFCRSNSGFRVLKNPHGGKAAAVLSGVKAANGEITLFTDMDQSTPISEVEKILPYYDQGYDVVFGSRGFSRENNTLSRKIASTVFRLFRQVLLLHQVADTQCGFKSFRSPLAKKVFPRLSVLKNQAVGWTVSAFDVELLFLSEKTGAKLKEVEVNWSNRDISTSKDRKFIGESIDMLKQIIAVKLNDLAGKYD